MLKTLSRRYRLILPIWLLLFGGLLIFNYMPSWNSSPAHAQTSRYRLSRLYYLSRVIFLINKHYVEQSQINPEKMFRQALEQIQKTVPSIMIRFAKDGKSVDVSVDKASKQFKLQGFPLIFSVPYQMRSIFTFIEANYRGDVEQRKIEFAAIHGMLKTLDTHTGFLPPSYYQDMQMHTRGSFGGLGIVIQSRKGYLTVVTPMPDTPASRVGLKALDRIVRIGDESTINMSLTEAVQKLRGEPGTKVEIWIQRKGFSQPKRFVITRAIINVKSVSAQLLPKQIGYIRIKNFQQDTEPDIRKALVDFHRRSRNRLRGLILDLRNNPGGLLSQAIKVSDLFLDQGTIVSHVGGLSRREVHQAHAFGTEPKYPIVVLVNNGSASASEIVAGALKNHNRAIILGQRTYGKGTVQVLYPIMPPRYAMREKSALKLTVAQYLTPGDISIQEIGIAPDISLNAVNISKNQVHFFGNVERKLKKKQLPRYLKGVREGRSALYSLSYFDARSEKERADSYQEDYGNKKNQKLDFETTLAKKLLLATDQWHRMSFYKKARTLLNQIRREEGRKVHAALKKVGVNWDKAPRKKSAHKPKLSFSYRILPPVKRKKTERAPRGNRVWAGSPFRLQVSIRNRGKETLYRVRAMTSSKYWFLHRKEFVFGKLRPGKTKRWVVDVKLPLWLKSQYHDLKIDLRSANKKFKQRKHAYLQIVGLPSPRYDFSYALEETRGNGDGRAQPGERFAVRVTVRNSGKGKSYQAIGLLKNKTGRELFIERGRIQFGALKPGQHATGWFYIRIHPFTQRKTIKMLISIFDAELHTTVRRQIVFPLAPQGLKKMKLRNRWISVNERSAWVYSGADFGTSRIAQASKGAKLQVVGKLGDFYQVKLPEQLWGVVTDKKARRHKPQWYAWVASRDVVPLASKSRNRNKLKLYWQAVTPQIAVKTQKYPKPITQENFILKGVVRNNVSLLDTYILVNGEKVYYRALRNIPKLQFSLPIKLKEGRNQIIIVARESTQFSGYHEVFLFHKKGKPRTKPSVKIVRQPSARE